MQYAVGVSFVLLVLVMYVPFLQRIFGTVALPIRDWAVMVPFILMASVAAELTKAFMRWRDRRSQAAA
jgi:hypothetical protein